MDGVACMGYRPKGKYVTINVDNPEALGICDGSGFVFRRSDMVKQMEWRGNALVWTGFIKGRKFIDEPNPQLKPPNIYRPDPIPVRDPRPPQYSGTPWDFQGTPWNLVNVLWEQWGGQSYQSPEIDYTTVGTQTIIPFDLDVPALPENQRAPALSQVYFGVF